MNAPSQDPTPISLTADVATAYLGQNAVAVDRIPDLIATIHRSLQDLSAEKEAAPLQPPVPIKRSITPGYLVCLEDGRRMKMLKRHLRARYGMTPDQYRAKWGLPPDYPMVCPDSSQKRVQIAKDSGLGKSRWAFLGDASADTSAAAQPELVGTPVKRRPGRPRRTDRSAG